MTFALCAKNEAGEIQCALVLFHDITELTKMDQVGWDFVANRFHERAHAARQSARLIETLPISPKTQREEAHPNSPSDERHSKRLELLVRKDLLERLRELESGILIYSWELSISRIFSRMIRDGKKVTSKQATWIIMFRPDLCPVE